MNNFCVMSHVAVLWFASFIKWLLLLCCFVVFCVSRFIFVVCGCRIVQSEPKQTNYKLHNYGFYFSDLKHDVNLLNLFFIFFSMFCFCWKPVLFLSLWLSWSSNEVFFFFTFIIVNNCRGLLCLTSLLHLLIIISIYLILTRPNSELVCISELWIPNTKYRSQLT